MKRPDSHPISDEKPVSRKLNIALILGAIGLAGFGGYKLGLDSRDEQVKKLEASSAENNKQLVTAEKNSRQCRQVVKNLVESRKVTVIQVAEMEGQLDQSDEAHCKDVMDKAARDKAEELAKFLCISNSRDITKLKESIRRNYSELLSVSVEGNLVELTETNSEFFVSDYVHLDEPMGCIPSEYIKFFDPDDDDEIKNLRMQVADGRYEEIIDNFDLESICPLNEEPAKNDEWGCQFLSDLHRSFTETSDLNERKDILCDGIVGRLATALDTPENNDWMYIDTSPERVKRDKMESLYTEALVQSAGLSDSGDLEEAMMRCMVPHYKNPSCGQVTAVETPADDEQGPLANEDPVVEDEGVATGGGAAEE